MTKLKWVWEPNELESFITPHFKIIGFYFIVKHIMNQCLLMSTHVIELLKIFSHIMEDGIVVSFYLFPFHQLQCSRATEIIAHPEIGQICCAKWPQASDWYRAQVKQVFQSTRTVCYHTNLLVYTVFPLLSAPSNWCSALGGRVL